MQKCIPHWYSPITVRQQQVTCAPFRAEPYEGEIAHYAVQAYGHILVMNGEGKDFTFAMLADQIEQTYDCRNPRNAEVVRVLMSLHLRNPHEPQKPIEYGFQDINGNTWCDPWVDTYNRLTEIINRSGDGIVDSLSEREREFYLDQRHRQHVQFADLARRAA